MLKERSWLSLVQFWKKEKGRKGFMYRKKKEERQLMTRASTGLLVKVIVFLLGAYYFSIFVNNNKINIQDNRKLWQQYFSLTANQY